MQCRSPDSPRAAALAKVTRHDKLLSMDGSSPALPAWVRKRDGGTQPFDADKINRALFAATETLGRPDAFVARELTDSVLHFLAAETDGGIVSAEQVFETLVKVVRELGQPQLAAAFVDHRGQRRGAPSPPHPVAPSPFGTHADRVTALLDAKFAFEPGYPLINSPSEISATLLPSEASGPKRKGQ